MACMSGYCGGSGIGQAGHDGWRSVGAVRRRSRQAVPRPRLVKFFLTDGELAELDEAAGQAGLARGAFAAEVTWQRRGACRRGWCRRCGKRWWS